VPRYRLICLQIADQQYHELPDGVRELIDHGMAVAGPGGLDVPVHAEANGEASLVGRLRSAPGSPRGRHRRRDRDRGDEPDAAHQRADDLGGDLLGRHDVAQRPPGNAEDQHRRERGTCVVGTRLLARQFTPRPRFLDALADLPTRFLPPGYLGEVETTFTPLRPAATVLYEWTGVVFWAVALAATTWVLHRTSVPAGDAAAARALLIRTGGSSLAWSATWSGNSYWFDARGRAAVAYRVLSGVALTTG
jgi:Phosphatidylglycerol lysyltransferase, C-terminal